MIPFRLTSCSRCQGTDPNCPNCHELLEENESLRAREEDRADEARELHEELSRRYDAAYQPVD